MAKVMVGLRIREEVIERARNTVHAIGTRANGMSINEWAEEGLKLVLDRLEHEHNKGRPFPQRPKGKE